MAKLHTTLTLHKKFTIDKVPPALFSGFIEHLGRAVYEGIYEPSHPTADEDGFRTDVIEYIKELNMPYTRYPGGNFVSGYRWEDGVGPVTERPVRLDYAWMTTESNLFGTNEFIKWCRKSNTEPMLAVNLGTRGAQEAADLVEYCNHPGGTALSELRKKHGFEKPHNVKLWCLGNEMDGPWQTCAKIAEEYGRVANEAAKMMKWVDPTIKLVACGSSGSGMPEFGRWETEVLDHTFANVEYLSIHQYYENSKNDYLTFLAGAEKMDHFIKEAVAMCDTVSARKKSNKKINISFDEWNVWFHSKGKDNEIYKKNPWGQAPHLLEDIYTFEDALLVGTLINTLLNNCDRVKVACIAQSVNVIAPIMTEKGGAAWKQTIFYPFALTSAFAKGTVLRTSISSETYEADLGKGVNEQINWLSCSAVHNEEKGELVLFCVNRSTEKAMVIDLEAAGFADIEPLSAVTLEHSDLKAVNGLDNLNNVVPKEGRLPVVENGTVKIEMNPATWSMFTLRVKG